MSGNLTDSHRSDLRSISCQVGPAFAQLNTLFPTLQQHPNRTMSHCALEQDQRTVSRTGALIVTCPGADSPFYVKCTVGTGSNTLQLVQLPPKPVLPDFEIAHPSSHSAKQHASFSSARLLPASVESWQPSSALQRLLLAITFARQCHYDRVTASTRA